MQCHGPQHGMGRLFNTYCHLQCQNNITICGFRLMIFLLLDMDGSTRFYVVKLQTKGNMKLQLGISQHAFAWIL
jgi:hypothetical protein